MILYLYVVVVCKSPKNAVSSDEAEAGVGEEERGLDQGGQYGLHSLHVRHLPSHHLRKLKYCPKTEIFR